MRPATCEFWRSPGDSDQTGSLKIYTGAMRRGGIAFFTDADEAAGRLFCAHPSGPHPARWKWGLWRTGRWGNECRSKAPSPIRVWAFLHAVSLETRGRRSNGRPWGIPGEFCSGFGWTMEARRVVWDTDGYFKVTEESSPFYAAAFDRRGFILLNFDGTWLHIPEHPGPRSDFGR